MENQNSAFGEIIMANTGDKLVQAKNFLMNNDVKTAKELLISIIEVEPENLDATFLMAQISEFEEDFEASATYYEKCFNTNLPIDVLERMAIVFEHVENYEKVYDVYRLILDNEPNDKANIERLAHIALLTSKNQEATELYNRILAIEPDDVAALNQLVDLYEDSNKLLYHFTKAKLLEAENQLSYAESEYKKAFTQAVTDEEMLMCHYKLAEIYKKREKYELAIDELTHVLTNDEHNFDILVELAEIYQQLGNVDAAIDMTKRALTVYPDNKDLKADLADLYFNDENYGKAKEVLLEAQLDDISSNITLAKIYIHEDENKKCFEILNKLEENNPENIEIITAFAGYYSHLNNFEKAKEYCDKIIRKLPNSPLGYRKLAEMYESQGNHFAAHFNFGKYHELKGETELAIDEYNFAFNIHNNDALVILKLAELHLKMGDKLIAADYYQKLFDIDNKNLNAIRNLTQIYFDLKEYEHSKRYAQIGIDEYPNEWEFYYLLAESTYNLKDYETALEIYRFYYDNSALAANDDIKNKISKLEKMLNPSEDEGFLNKIINFFSKKD